eukprot:4900266-Pyramimonas_sp.AAC.1
MDVERPPLLRATPRSPHHPSTLLHLHSHPKTGNQQPRPRRRRVAAVTCCGPSPWRAGRTPVAVGARNGPGIGARLRTSDSSDRATTS